MAVSVRHLEGDVQIGKPRLLFEGSYSPRFDVSHDGQSFIMSSPEGTPTSDHLELVLNWFRELERLVPSEN